MKRIDLVVTIHLPPPFPLLSPTRTGDCGPSFLTGYVRFSTNYEQIKQYKKWKLKYWE